MDGSHDFSLILCFFFRFLCLTWSTRLEKSPHFLLTVIAFDFAADMGAASIVSTSWTCTLAPYQTATDPAPQTRVLAASARTAIEVRSPIDGFLEMRNGFFSVASVGGMPISAVGGTYILEATAVLDDGRVLKLNATVLCSAPG